MGVSVANSRTAVKVPRVAQNFVKHMGVEKTAGGVKKYLHIVEIFCLIKLKIISQDCVTGLHEEGWAFVHPIVPLCKSVKACQVPLLTAQ